MNDQNNSPDDQNKKDLPGNPVYSPEEDIYNQSDKTSLGEDGLPIGEKENPPADELDEGLDVPGADLDDANEKLGEEDEENNYYSLDDQD